MNITTFQDLCNQMDRIVDGSCGCIAKLGKLAKELNVPFSAIQAEADARGLVITRVGKHGLEVGRF